MWIQWKLFDKIVENLNFDLFGGPRMTQKLGPMGCIFLQTYKELENQVWLESSGKL